MPKPTQRDGGAVARARSRFRREDAAASPPPPDTGRVGREGRVPERVPGLTGEVVDFLRRYIVLNDNEVIVVAAWLLASRSMDSWDRFPILTVTSPEPRCGKTRTLEALELLAANALSAVNLTPAVIYRAIAARMPTLILDEAQSLSRRGSEASEVVREIFCGSIDRHAKVYRCTGDDHTVTPFPIACPKILAKIGAVDGVLADRSVCVRLRRKTKGETVERWIRRRVKPGAEKLSERLDRWALRNRARLTRTYEEAEPLDVENDRMGEILLPLDAVLTLDAPGLRPVLVEYARRHEEAERAAEQQTPGVRLLVACRELFAAVAADPATGRRFLSTPELIRRLVGRTEEPWATYSRGRAITPEALAGVLRPYGIRSDRSKDRTKRGFYAAAFEPAWDRYCP